MPHVDPLGWTYMYVSQRRLKATTFRCLSSVGTDICRREKARNVVFRLFDGLNLKVTTIFVCHQWNENICQKEIGKETERCVPPPSPMTSRGGTFVWLATTWHKDAGSYLYLRYKHTVFRDLLFLSHRKTHCRPTFLNPQSMGRGTFPFPLLIWYVEDFVSFLFSFNWDEPSYNKITKSFSLDFVWFIK